MQIFRKAPKKKPTVRKLKNATATQQGGKFKFMNKNLIVSLQDKKQRNFYHYMISPCGWENVQLLESVYNALGSSYKQLLVQKDRYGRTLGTEFGIFVFELRTGFGIQLGNSWLHLCQNRTPPQTWAHFFRWGGGG
jgi:hypothetical protein